MATVTTGRVSLDEFLAMPNHEDCELIEGEVREREMGLKSSSIALRIGSKLDSYAETHGGWVFGADGGYVVFGEFGDTLKKPDVSYVAPGRMKEPPDGYGEIVPDLVVEVVSPNDSFYEVSEKVLLYQRHGVRSIWVVDPAAKEIEVVREKNRRVFTAGEELTEPDLLPGFSLSVMAVFPRPIDDGQ